MVQTASAPSAQDSFLVRFWGVRGSIACPGQRYQRYGGNTSCVEVRLGERLVIFDCGSGLRPLGEALQAEADASGQPIDADIFLSHAHVDHIQGLPFFPPLFRPENRFRIWAGHLADGIKVRDVLSKYMAAPLFPVPPEIFAADVTFNDFRAGETLRVLPGATLRTAPLNHPQGSTGYRIDFQGRSFCYVTDTEHQEGGLDQNILELVAGADVMVYDSTYSDAEYPRYRGWGHSTWEECLRVADKAGVEQVVLFHHDPGHDDTKMDAIAAAAADRRPGTLVAREGLELRL